jgi:hypothetical protein
MSGPSGPPCELLSILPPVPVTKSSDSASDVIAESSSDMRPWRSAAVAIPGIPRPLVLPSRDGVAIGRPADQLPPGSSRNSSSSHISASSSDTDAEIPILVMSPSAEPAVDPGPMASDG